MLVRIARKDLFGEWPRLWRDAVLLNQRRLQQREGEEEEERDCPGGKADKRSEERIKQPGTCCAELKTGPLGALAKHVQQERPLGQIVIKRDLRQ